MKACCCTLAGTSACVHCPNNQPYPGFYTHTIPHPAIDYRKLAEELAKILKCG